MKIETTKKIPLTIVIIYEAPYELEDHHVYRILRKFGKIKGGISRHKHRGTNIENGNRSIIYASEPQNIPGTLWIQGNKVKIRYDGQNRKPFCSHCKVLGHYYKDCEEYANAFEENDARIEQAELEEIEEARIRKEEQERREEEKRIERERILREVE